MSAQRVKRALLSVYDKTGIVEFARALHEEFGIEIISTGGTAELLRESGVPVTLVEEITGIGEMLGGRVKTLHPKIHAAILADRDNPEHMRQLADLGVEPIDMVVVNLYPFEQTVARPDCTPEEAMEMIDIGGPCLLRAAAKNHQHVVVVRNRERYPHILNWIRSRALDEHRVELAEDVFGLTNAYDLEIRAFFERIFAGRNRTATHLHDLLIAWFFRREELRYGENPHQQGALYGDAIKGERPGFERVSDTPLSFNNFVDADEALALVKEFSSAEVTQPRAVAFVKHTNPCGVAVGDDPIDTYRRAYLGDPQAAMGGVLAVNFAVDAGFAEAVMNSLGRWGRDAGAGAFFLEVWVAPSFDEDAVKLIQTAKPWGNRARLLAVGDMTAPPDANELDLRRITGGMLVQTRDLAGLNEDRWKVVTQRRPTEQETVDLRLAWLVCKHTKSNAVTICKDGMLIGNGAGQMSRVMSCRIATWLARENGHADKLAGSVAASDAFFPFRDGPDLLMDAGVGAIIQPGGSKRDAETIAACDERGAAMILTGTRHLRH